jgi:CO/xanthine dehydrogenase FAD-binding subunit
MIKNYYRPSNLEEALDLLSRDDVDIYPLGGGTRLSQSSALPIAVVDLQDLGLSDIHLRGNWLEIGATSTLQSLYDYDLTPDPLRQAITLETNYNIRQAGTIAGTIVTADGRSTLVTALLAVESIIEFMPNEVKVALGDMLAARAAQLKKRLITKISIPLNVHLAFKYVSRSPADLPQVCVAVAKWSSGRTRVTLGGYGEVPRLVLDGPDSNGAVEAACAAYSTAGDEWASADFRQDVAATLTRRCIADLS